MHNDAFAKSFAFFNAGSSIAARIAMIAITTNSSIRVKALPNADCRLPILDPVALEKKEYPVRRKHDMRERTVAG